MNLEYKFINLTSLYGIQNMEVNKFTIDMYEKELNKYIISLKMEIMKFDLNSELEYDNARHTPYDDIKHKFKENIKHKYFNDIKQDNILHEDIDMFIDYAFRDASSSKTNNISPFVFYKSQLNVMHFFHKKVFPKLNIAYQKLTELLEKSNVIEEKIQHMYRYDYFNKNCLFWCYYTIILIIINPSIDPYDIIKISFFQSNDINDINIIYNKYVKKSSDTIEDEINKIFNIEYLDKKIAELDTFLDTLRTDPDTNVLMNHKKILYVKVTNLIILTTLYNRTYDKYLLYSVKDNTDDFKVNFIPQKVEEIFNNFSIAGTNQTDQIIFRNTIMNNLKIGSPIDIINSAILLRRDKVFHLHGGVNNYYNKYLIYKNKCLQLNYL